MICASFAALPGATRQEVYRRLSDLLTASELPPKFAHLARTDRRALAEIVGDTIPEFAAIASR
jgi:hypothetical protein